MARPRLTTSVAVRDNPSGATALLNPDFSTAAGSGQVTFIVTAIPEPGSTVWLGIAALIVGLRSRSRS